MFDIIQKSRRQQYEAVILRSTHKYHFELQTLLNCELLRMLTFLYVPIQMN